MRISQWTPISQSFLTTTASGVVAVLLISVFFSLEIRGENGGGKQQLRRHAADDDELHDEEIFRAVVQSLNEWQQRKQQKQMNDSHRRVKRDEEIVCYGELGCFRDEGPFDYLDMLPSPPEEIGTKFMVFTRQNREVPQVFSYFNFTAMYNSHFNATIPTKVIIHGFGSTCNRIWASEMRLALLSVVECNIICVDWENGAAMPNYVRAAVNTRLVGKQVAMLIFWLNDHLGSQTQDYHLVGFSLGAHVAGFAGQELKNLSRITGLDPAGPLFESYDSKVRLDTEDALFVDVIHSNGDSLLMGGLGSWEPMGHVDFYPNGGRVQKGCSNLFLGAVRDFLWSASDGDGRSLCNHRRAYKFFTESVSPRCAFPAFACDNYEKFLTGNCFSWDASHCGNMGYYADRLPNPKKGLLYLITREDEPFCANQFRITIESSPSSAPVTTYGGLEAVLIGQDFINETFLITQTVKDNMIAGSVIQRMIVAHPAVTEPIQIQLKYTAYQGWIYSGISRWSLERLIITNAYGKSMSFCSRGLLLPSGIPLKISLTSGICVNRFSVGSTSNNVIGNAPNRPVQGTYPHDIRPPTSDNSAAQLASVGTDNSTITSIVSPSEDTSLYPVETQGVIGTSMKPPDFINNYPPGVGPTYQLQANDMDWSQWQPLSPAATLNNANDGSEPNKNDILVNQNKFSSFGTPVETYPAVAAEDYDDEISQLHSGSENNFENQNYTIKSELNENHTGSTQSHQPELEVQHSVYSPLFLTQTKNLTTPTSEQAPAKVRICYEKTTTTVQRNSTKQPEDEETYFTDRSKFTCIDQDEISFQTANLASLPSHSNSHGEGNIWNHKNESVNVYDTITSNDLRASHASEYSLVSPPMLDIPDSYSNANEFNAIPVPPPSFWTAIQHNNTQTSNTVAQGQTGDPGPGISLPPHLQYILQQLDRQGFGPKSTSADSSQNFRFHQSSGQYRGLVPSSRALKPRPVVLSSRRQAKAIDVNKNNVKSLSPPGTSSPIIGPMVSSNHYRQRHNPEIRYNAVHLRQSPHIHAHPGQQLPMFGPPKILMQSLAPQISSNTIVQSIFVAPLQNTDNQQRPIPRLISTVIPSGHRRIGLAVSPRGLSKIPPQIQAMPALNMHQLSNSNSRGGLHPSNSSNVVLNIGFGQSTTHHGDPPVSTSMLSKNKGYYILPYFAQDRNVASMGMMPLRRRLTTNRRLIPVPGAPNMEVDATPSGSNLGGGSTNSGNAMEGHKYASVNSGNTMKTLATASNNSSVNVNIGAGEQSSINYFDDTRARLNSVNVNVIHRQ